MTTTVFTFTVDGADNLLHIVADSACREAFIIDPAWDASAIIQQLEQYQLTPVGILLTHTHADHTSAVKPLLAKYDIPVYVSEAEYAVGRIHLDKPHWVRDGDCINLGAQKIEVIATPGHTAGGVTYKTNNALIVGDTLFIDGCGHCDFPDSDAHQLFDSLQRLKSLADALSIYCGHDYGQQPIDSLGRQKQTNPYLLIEDRAFFVAFRMHLQSQYRSIPFEPSSAEAMQQIYQRHAPF
ncbi:MBL fold metallo-hydrolase [Ostreibacterium oceani]|uniref:MBL fold metallo-hydrolase n=1 Tax=Ostreibacterium oceani TaxID=2654998 RepID=A0A6N7EVY2_9GAMM|nr:MBL fold metallo-hydrolase [Ostreibacterium oceani]MPV86711.1 MBL fold metallo-hydrolase [Ostreibacterium oceani]